MLLLSAARTTLPPVYATTTNTEPLARNIPEHTLTLAVEPQVGVNTAIHYERLLHVLRLVIWR